MTLQARTNGLGGGKGKTRWKNDDGGQDTLKRAMIAINVLNLDRHVRYNLLGLKVTARTHVRWSENDQKVQRTVEKAIPRTIQEHCAKRGGNHS